MRFDFVFGVAVGDGVGETFLCFGEAVGDGLGVGFFVELFRCLRGGGVGVAKIFLIFVPNDSSAVPGVPITPKQIVASRRIRRIILIARNNQRASSCRIALLRRIPPSKFSDRNAIDGAGRIILHLRCFRKRIRGAELAMQTQHVVQCKCLCEAQTTRPQQLATQGNYE